MVTKERLEQFGVQMMACINDRIHRLMQQLRAPEPPRNRGLNGYSHPVSNEIPNGGPTNRANLPEQVNVQRLVAQEAIPRPSQVRPNPQNPAPPNIAPPLPNSIALVNGDSHREVLEEESSYHPPNKNQHRTRKRIPRSDVSRRSREDLSDLEDDSPLASNLINTPLPKFKFLF